MVQILINILLINISIAFIYNYFNAPQDMADSIISIITKGKIKQCELKKPLGCPVCMTFWITLIYLIIAVPFTFYYLLLALVLSLTSAFFNKFTGAIITSIDMWISKIIEFFYK